MEKPEPEKVPLTTDEKDLLLTVFSKRRTFLFFVYILLVVIALMYSTHGVDIRSPYTGKVVRWEEQDDAKAVPRFWMWIINLTWLEGIVISTGIYFYMKRVHPFRYDANSGVREKVPYTIVRKEFFPLTNQYYVALDDPNYLHHQITEDEYYNCTEGGTIYIYRAVKSKFVFEEDGRYSIL